MKQDRFAPKVVILLAVATSLAALAAEREPLLLPLNSVMGDAPRKQTEEDRLITDHIAKIRDKLVRVTEKPLFVENPRLLICNAPEGLSFKPTTHEEFWIHVFINPEAAGIIKSGKGVYPEGTIILKQKFLDAEAKQTEFYTGMRKREKDYNPEYGDWEFFTLDQTGTKVTARGRIDSCMDCHANWKETDFVSRKYLRPPPAAPVTR